MSSIKKVLCLKAKNNDDRTFTAGCIYDVEYHSGYYRAKDDNGFFTAIFIDDACIYGEWQPLEEYVCMTATYSPMLNIGDIVTGYVTNGVLKIPCGINSKQFSHIESFKKLSEMNSDPKPRHEVRHVVYDTKNNKIVNDAMGECYITLAEAHELCDEMNAPKVMKPVFTKEVEYFGVKIMVPENSKYLATNGMGSVYASNKELTASNINDYWCTTGAGTLALITKVDLNGIDWRETLMEIK